MIGQTISHYKILAKLGGGGMGIVYKAEDTKLKRTVALKFLPPELTRDEEAKERFVQEAQTASALDHPNICTIYEIDEIPITLSFPSVEETGQLFIAMAYYDGETLKKKVSSNQLSVSSVIDFAMQIARGLAKAHQHGIVHRDIKPANVMVTGEGVVKIIDFGLSKLAGTKSLTKPGTTLGTPAYMSPEQMSQVEVDHRTDIWSLGVVMYEMATRQLPFREENELALVYSIVNEKPAPITTLRPDLPIELERIVDKAMQKDRRKRYQRMEELLVDLRRLKGEPMPSEALPAVPIPAKTPKKKARTLQQTSDDKGDSNISTAERRQITALSCKLTISSSRSDEVDPEDYYEVLVEWQKRYRGEGRKYAGHLAREDDAAILLYFGFPQAHEDDARRAVLCGLDMLKHVEQMTRQFSRKKNLTLSASIGIHTGDVVAGDGIGTRGRDSKKIFGEVPAIAGQLQAAAKAGSLVVSPTTYRLIEGYFHCQEFGLCELKSHNRPVTVFQVLQKNPARSRLEAAVPAGLSPLIGREQELSLLQERWHQVADGVGQIVLLSGEAGIGKSRLVYEFKQHVSGNAEAWLGECYCSPYDQGTALFPLIAWLERDVLKFEKNDGAQEKLQKIEALVSSQKGSLANETALLFAALLSIPIAEKAPLDLSPQQQRQKTLEALVNLFLTRAAELPSLFILEDVHWADPTTMEFLDLMMVQIPATRLCLILTCRPEFTAPSSMRSHLYALTLARLPRKKIEQMVDFVAGGKELPIDVRRQIVSKTDGVPLFVEELTKAVVESGALREQNDRYEFAGALTELSVPATLNDSLMARLDRQGAAKEIAQVGAVLGREFHYRWLQSVCPFEENALQQALAQLVKSELLFKRGMVQEASYVFKHALIRDAAYESLLKKTRKYYHEKIARVFADGFPEIAESRPEILAHHYTAAGKKKEAVDFWRRAGFHALQRSACVEAAAHLSKGLAIIKTMPNTQKRSQPELEMLTGLGPAIIYTKGFGVQEVKQIYARARKLCRRAGETAQLFPVLFGAGVFYCARADYSAARELREQMMRIAEREDDHALIIEACWMEGATRYYQAEFEQAKALLERGIALYDPQKHHALSMQFTGSDPCVNSLSYMIWTFWLLGFPEKARACLRKIIELSGELSHPMSQLFALNAADWLHSLTGEAEAVLENVPKVISLASDLMSGSFVALGTIFQGWATAKMEKEKKGIIAMNKGLAQCHDSGLTSGRTFFLGLLAEACLTHGDAAEGLQAVAEALAMAKKTGERMHEAELFRLKGELLLQQHQPASKAEPCFRRALEISRRQKAKSFELRAAVGLARLWQKQNKSRQARQLLQPVYGWFTEGFDTPDLCAAKALLESLASSL